MAFFLVPIDIMYMYLFLWYLLLLKIALIVKNGNGFFFLVSKSCPKAQQNTLLFCLIIVTSRNNLPNCEHVLSYQ